MKECVVGKRCDGDIVAWAFEQAALLRKRE
jgi:hypothetical protein